MKIYRIHALICAGAQCLAAGGNGFEDALKEELKKHDLTEEVNIVETGCMGSCQLGPLMVVYPEGVIYTKVKPEDAKEIVEEHFLKGRPVKRLLWRQEEKQFPTLSEVPFFAKQTKIVLRNCGIINPEDITEYIAQGGYEALAKAITEMTREEVIKVVKDSGLRGRGGAGFPTGLKWELAYKQKSDTKYIICNADEGDPGAYMDRSILEGDPHSVLEGMAIAGYAVQAQKGYIYIRAEYPLAIKRLEIAIKQARASGLLGKNILGTNFSFDIELRMGAGAFVCGEETALINSIEGKRGEPRKKPPFPVERGVFGKPTVINNVETLANIPVIVGKGASFFRKFGTEKSPGTKVFALAGKVNITGLVEVPLGTPLRTIVFDIGGGIPEGHTFKAAQTGGPSGGVIPAEHLDVPMDYENLPQLGTIMGSGGLIIMDETSCMVDVAKFFLKFTVDESCGKCTPCREGTRQMLNILEKITSGNGTMEDLDRLERLGNVIKLTSLCGLGQTAPNPVLSTLRYFKDEYIAHIKGKKCPANVCTMKGERHERKVLNRRPA
ncbi:NADH-quinone oxidoreductase subunit NuoF [Caldisericum exile]|uniref:NADH dehydrogenase subunit n=1 Tax=Caldisericum exile (strain DSM 21853 / NBRC 104410 / AZM16c01) TaxID=511051 RepID=A0A7U6JH34_CALEA|nr:NADH-quinone oxidoreductase subunit NuoF [Caldisericum exile]BAL81322.1 putative NADH dehydrogenase subunit [Caldisericum exile AZM16c01]